MKRLKTLMVFILAGMMLLVGLPNTYARSLAFQHVEQPTSQPQTQQQVTQSQPDDPYLELIQAKEPKFVCPPIGRNVIGYSDKEGVRQVVIGNVSSDEFPNHYQLEIVPLQPENFDLARTALATFIGDNANEIIDAAKQLGDFEPAVSKNYDGKTIIYYSRWRYVYIQIYCDGLER